MLELLGVRTVRLMTNNPAKVAALEAAGTTVVERVPHALPADESVSSLLQSVFAESPSAPLSLFVLVTVTVLSLAWAMRIVERKEYVLEQ